MLYIYIYTYLCICVLLVYVHVSRFPRDAKMNFWTNYLFQHYFCVCYIRWSFSILVIVFHCNQSPTWSKYNTIFNRVSLWDVFFKPCVQCFLWRSANQENLLNTLTLPAHHCPQHPGISMQSTPKNHAQSAVVFCFFKITVYIIYMISLIANFIASAFTKFMFNPPT